MMPTRKYLHHAIAALSLGMLLLRRVSHIAGQLRATLGVSVRRFARIVGCSPASISRWELGQSRMHPLYARRIQSLWRAQHRSLTHRWDVPVTYVDAERLWHYLAKPGPAYQHWTWKRRLSFMAHRATYNRILADAQAGRCRLEYVYRDGPTLPRRSIFEDAIIRLARRHGIDLTAIAGDV